MQVVLLDPGTTVVAGMPVRVATADWMLAAVFFASLLNAMGELAVPLNVSRKSPPLTPLGNVRLKSSRW